MYHPFTSKASLFPAAKKKMVCYIGIFFSARTKYVHAQSCAEAHSGQNQNFFFRAFRTFFLVFCVFRALAAARARSPLWLCAKPAVRRNYQHKACCSQSSPLSNILRISVRAKPAAHRALLFQPLTQTTHSSEGLSFGNPLWQNPKSSP